MGALLAVHRLSASGEAARPGSGCRLPSAPGSELPPGSASPGAAPQPSQTLCLAFRLLLLLPARPSNAHHSPRPGGARGATRFPLTQLLKDTMLSEDPGRFCSGPLPTAAVRVPRPLLWLPLSGAGDHTFFLRPKSTVTRVPFSGPLSSPLDSEAIRGVGDPIYFLQAHHTQGLHEAPRTQNGQNKVPAPLGSRETRGRGRAKQGWAALQRVQVGEAPRPAWGGGGQDRFPGGDPGGET